LGTARATRDRRRGGADLRHDRIAGRLLIAQGANDPNVTPGNVRVAEGALKRAQVPFETLMFADEGRGVRKPENLRVLYARLIEFFGDAFARSDARS
jgi:dipeptidyl aminopeptidase/acylaminoacyl peptidase